jgi:uncharacterized protein YecE (DUF72 family)
VRPEVFIGTAGWTIPRAHASFFPQAGSSLSRYASVFNAAEINSTFYRPHRPTTFERLRDSVPAAFRFAVKVPKTITHELRLVDAIGAFASFVTSISGLGDRLGPLLLQLPPKLAFDATAVKAFLGEARDLSSSVLVFEPRHASWFSGEADALLAEYDVVRAGADPERAPGAFRSGGSRRLTYLRLHGSPRVYFSSYETDFIWDLATRLGCSPAPTWCIFDNTASGAAAGDGLRLMRAIIGESTGQSASGIR